MKIEIFVVNIDYCKELTDVTIPTIKQYAKKISAKFTEITQRKFPDMHPSYEKLQVYNLGRDNDWNIIIDADFLLGEDMYNVIDLIPDNGNFYVGCWEAYNGTLYFNNKIEIGVASNFLVIPKSCIEILKPLDQDEDYTEYCNRPAYVNEYCISLNLQKLKYTLAGLEIPNTRDKLFKHLNISTDNISFDNAIKEAKQFISPNKVIQSSIHPYCVVTLAIGDEYQLLSKYTHPTLSKYAEKINADFFVINKQEVSKTTVHWEKFKLYDLLQKYQRILYVDSDILIRDDCPNLFDIVPEDEIGMFDEAPFTDRMGTIQDISRYVNREIKSYYNTGVMVLSKIHRSIFTLPEVEENNFYEQTYINMRTAEGMFDVYNLDYKFNRMCCMDNIIGIHRLDSYIIHYAGCSNFSVLKNLIKSDLTRLNSEETYKQKILISVEGGLGDQICAQPAVRSFKKNHSNSEIIVKTQYPELFENSIHHNDFKFEDDMPYIRLFTFPPPTSLLYTMISPILCHTIDYCSISLLKRMLPKSERYFEIPVRASAIKSLKTKINLKDLILIHPGKHWDTKTLPLEWWEEVVEILVNQNKNVGIIGKTGMPGVWKLSNGVDLVDKLDLYELFAIISKAKLLITNDSAPVHIANGFNNKIVVIPTVKHPEHISESRKTKAIYKKLLLNDYNVSSITLKEINIDKMKYNWSRYIYEPIDFVRKLYE